MTKQGSVSGWSIRTLFALLVLAAFVPLAVSIAYHFQQHAEIQKRAAARTVHGLASSSAAAIRRVLEDTQRTAGLLAARPQARSMDRAQCDPMLRELHAILPVHANASVLDLNGRFVCSARPLPDPAPVPVRHSAFERALHGEASLSEPVRGALSRLWIVAAAHPVRDGAGPVIGVATITIDLARLTPLAEARATQIDTLATIISGDGIVIARSVAAEYWMGKRIDEVPLYRKAIAAGVDTITASGLDGIERIYGIAPVGVEGWRVIVGSPSADLLAEARTEARTYVVFATIALLLFGIAAAVIATRLAGPVLDMDRALKLRAAGKAEARIPEHGPRELATLARDLNAALDAQQMAAIRLSGIIASAMDAIITVDEKRQIILVNPAAESMFRRPAAELLDKSLNLLIPARFHALHDRHIREFGETGVTSRAMGKLGEIVGLRANGEEFPVEASISQLETVSGKLFTVILRDVTRRRQAENALRRSAEEMRILSQRLSEVEESERRSIHCELHDQIGANLAALKLDLAIVDSVLPQDVRMKMGNRLERARQLTGETITRVRNVMAELRPPALDDFGLVTALRMHGESVAARLEIPVTIEASDLEPRLPPAVETALFRIVQEALHNIVKHSRARSVRIAIAEKPDRIILSVADDGTGFHPTSVDPQRTNWGLRTMRERAQAIGAGFRVESSPGAGTRVTVELTRKTA